MGLAGRHRPQAPPSPPPAHAPALQLGLIVSVARTGDPLAVVVQRGRAGTALRYGFGATGRVFGSAHIQLTPPTIKAHEPGCEYAGSEQNVGISLNLTEDECTV